MTVIHPPPSDESGTAEDAQTTPQPGSLREATETAEPDSGDRLHEAEVDEEDDEEEEEEEEKEGKAKQITSHRTLHWNNLVNTLYELHSRFLVQR